MSVREGFLREVTASTETAAVAAAGGAVRTAPPRAPTFRNYAHTAAAWPLVALYTMLMATLSLACSPFDRRGRLQHWCASTWSRMIARTALLDVRVHGAEHLRAGESYVFLSTHQSWMDIPVMLGYLPAQLRIAAKREVFHIPFLGWHLRRAGHIPINRGSTVLRPGPVELYIDPPPPTRGLADADLPALMQQVRDAMEKNFKEPKEVAGSR
jgi:1-acyl-sn-glycerol-3-phosphate acyltransferase